jgi:hypothetical protein
MMLIVFSKSEGLNENQFINVLQKAYKNQVEKVLEAHPLLQDAWKDKIRAAIGDLPGINLK